MADFAVLGTALESVLKYKSGSFVHSYQKTQKEMQLNALENHSIMLCLMDYIEKEGQYKGPYQQLYINLNERYKKFKYSDWPSSVEVFAKLLRKQQMALKELNFDLHIDPIRKKDGRHIIISKSTETPQFNNILKKSHQIQLKQKFKK